VVIAVSTGAEQGAPGRREPIPTEELVRRRGARPIENPHDMARDVFESDEELDEFLAFIAAARRADLA